MKKISISIAALALLLAACAPTKLKTYKTYILPDGQEMQVTQHNVFILRPTQRLISVNMSIQAAREMRTAQKNYFAANDQMSKQEWLKQAKNKEYKFDQLLEKI